MIFLFLPYINIWKLWDRPLMKLAELICLKLSTVKLFKNNIWFYNKRNYRECTKYLE